MKFLVGPVVLKDLIKVMNRLSNRLFSFNHEIGMLEFLKEFYTSKREIQIYGTNLLN